MHLTSRRWQYGRCFIMSGNKEVDRPTVHRLLAVVATQLPCRASASQSQSHPDAAMQGNNSPKTQNFKQVALSLERSLVPSCAAS